MHQQGKSLAVLGVSLQLALVVCGTISVNHLILAFQRTAATSSPSPESLAVEVQHASTFSAVGAVLGIVGMGLILLTLFRFRYRARWYYGVLWPCACVWLLMFPIGTILGIAMMVYLVNHKAEFYGAPLGGLSQSTGSQL